MLLFSLSKIITQRLGLLIYRLTKNRNLTIGLLSVIFLPGTTIHEFAHATMAQILGVHVGEIELTPKIEGRNIRLGSVQTASTDPFRNFLIGAAPIIIGLSLILITIAIYAQLSISGFWTQVLLFYILFQIGNTMFSSSRDMEGAMALIIALAFLAGILYIVGLKSVFAEIINLSNRLQPFFKMTTDSLIKIIILDLVVIFIARVLTSEAK